MPRATAAKSKSKPKARAPPPPPSSLLDAQLRHRQHPRTFEVPTQSALRNIQPDDLVKICDEQAGERFWVIVKAVRPGGLLTGRVDNELISAPYAVGDSTSWTS